MEFTLTATVQLVNRAAEAQGVGGRMSRPAKSVIKLRNVTDGRTQILVATNKDPVHQRFYVNDIGVMRSRFLCQGMLTIEMSQPPINIMIREADQENLGKFIERLKNGLNPQQPITTSENGSSSSTQALSSNAGESSKTEQKSRRKLAQFQSSSKSPCRSLVEIPTSSVKVSKSSAVRNRSHTETESQKSNDVASLLRPRESSQRSVSNQLPTSSTERANNTGTLRQSSLNFPVLSQNNREFVIHHHLSSYSSSSLQYCAVARPHKRTRSPEISKNEVKSIKRQLKRNELSLTIQNRTSYFTALEEDVSKSLQCLTITNARLRQFDDKFLALKHLSVLDLCDNKLSSINQLKMLSSPLTILKVARNQIETIDHDLFNSFRDLKVLDLQQNLLKVLPNSIIHLSQLYSLIVSKNMLQFLPYNMQYMKNLMELKVDSNHLNFIPFPLTVMKFAKLRKLDISDNSCKGVPREWEPIGNYHGFGTKCAPSLLEITGEMLINQRCLVNEIDPIVATDIPFYDLPTNIVPKSLKEYLVHAKKCKQCLKMSLRYHYRVTKQPSNWLADEICASSPMVSVKSAVCTSCFLNHNEVK